jgi:hypothetical protein
MGQQPEQRMNMRFNKAFPVIVGSEVFGDSRGIARNISSGGMLVEMFDPLPLGSFVTVHFRSPDSHGDVVAHAEVKHHYCFNFASDGEPSSTRGIGLRFVEFVEDSAHRFRHSFVRQRVLH